MTDTERLDAIENGTVIFQKIDGGGWSARHKDSDGFDVNSWVVCATLRGAIDAALQWRSSTFRAFIHQIQELGLEKVVPETIQVGDFLFQKFSFAWSVDGFNVRVDVTTRESFDALDALFKRGSVFKPCVMQLDRRCSIEFQCVFNRYLHQDGGLIRAEFIGSGEVSFTRKPESRVRGY